MNPVSALSQLEHWLLSLQGLFLIYLAMINGGYILLNLLSIVSLRSYMARHALDKLPRPFNGFEPPISLLVPAYNEEATIVASVRSLLQLNYPDYEIVVINDGSRDGTLEQLRREFSLIDYPAATRQQVPCKALRGSYRSTAYANLRVIDKENGGKADALNTGINASRYPLFCAIDADSILDPEALFKVAQPFIDDPLTIATGGTIRIANGCSVSGGVLQEIDLPDGMLARFQIIEYLRAFLFGRLGWSPLNAVLIISGAFGLFKKEAVIAAGGYRTDTVGEDMELIVRLHRIYRLGRKPYRITYVPDPICWTEAPESLKVLKSQRTRWQRGLAESLSMNLKLLFHPRSGAVGWLAFPFFVLFEWFGPVIEVVGYFSLVVGAAFGLISLSAFETFMFLALSFGILLSTSALLLEEMSFRLYPKASQLVGLSIATVLENLGYRQLVSWWRFQGLLRWAFRTKGHWGEMTRLKSWRKDRQG